MNIILIDGAYHQGFSEEDIVKSMTRRDHECTDFIEYMKAVKRRIKESQGISIDFINPAGFLTELNRIGLIQQINK